MKNPANEIPQGNREFCKFWLILRKPLVNFQFAKFRKFNSSKHFEFLNRANFLISYKKLLQHVKCLSCVIL